MHESPAKQQRYNKLSHVNNYESFVKIANDFDDLDKELGTSQTVEFAKQVLADIARDQSVAARVGKNLSQTLDKKLSQISGGLPRQL